MTRGIFLPLLPVEAVPNSYQLAQSLKVIQKKKVRHPKYCTYTHTADAHTSVCVHNDMQYFKGLVTQAFKTVKCRDVIVVSESL